MLMAKAKTAIIRNGTVIPGGTPFGIRESERDEMDARGFKVFEVADPTSKPVAASIAPETANDNMPPEKEPGEIPEKIPEAKPEDIKASVAADESPKVLSGSKTGTASKMGATKAKEKK